MMFRAAKNSPVPRRSVDANERVWTGLRGDLHALALARGASLVGLARWQPDCDGLNGRDLEVWQPILAMARFVEDAGADGLLEILKEYALKSSKATNDDMVPESDEILLQLLKQEVAEKPWGITAGELLEKAKAENPAIFSRYGARGVGAVLNRYGIKSDRSGGESCGSVGARSHTSQERRKVKLQAYSSRHIRSRTRTASGFARNPSSGTLTTKRPTAQGKGSEVSRT
ncbi:MAG: DUF3631 domain-containing protein, partial [Phycisphaerales bacterium]